MTFRMLDNQGEIEGYASTVAQVAGIPQQHVEKDFWITEALRGVANASRETNCSVLIEIGTRGGALPFVRRPVQSLIAEYAERAGLDAEFEEIEPVSLLVLEPAWTPDQDEVEQSYNDVLRLLVWPNADTSTFGECCQRVHELADLL